MPRSARQNKTPLYWTRNKRTKLREQFVAILAHDLRNPLASIDAGVNVILRRNPEEKTRAIGEQIHKSARRMAALIDDILDFARGWLGGGFMLERNPNAPLSDQLEQVISELRDLSENPIEARIALTHPVNCDPKRVAQIASNLVANAMKHGAPGRPIRVLASTDEKGLNFRSRTKASRSIPLSCNGCFNPSFAETVGRRTRALASGFTSRPKSPARTAVRSRLLLRKKRPAFTLLIPAA